MLKFLKKNKRTIIAIFGFALLVMPIAVLAAKGTIPLPDSSNYGDVIAPPNGLSGKEQAVSLVEGIIRNFKLIAGILGIGIISLLAIMILFARGNEDEIKKYQQGMVWVVIALAVISISGDVAKILGPQDGGLIGDPNTILSRAQLFDFKVNIIITFIKYLLGSIGVVFLIRIGLRLITVSDNEENTTQDKKAIAGIAIGLLLVYLADIIINKVLYKVDKTSYPSVEGVQPSFDVNTGLAEIIGFTNFVVTLVSPVVIAVLVAGGIMYITAAGEEEKTSQAKRMIFSAIIGLIIIYGAFAVVNTFIPESVVATV